MEKQENLLVYHEINMMISGFLYMAQATQQDIQALIAAIGKLTQAMGGSTARQSSYSPNSISGNGNSNGNRRGSNQNNQNAFQQKMNSITNAGGIADQLGKAFKHISAAAKGVGDIYKDLEKNTRNQSAEMRKLNGVLVDFIGKADNAADALKSLKDMSDKVKDTMSSYDADIKKYQISLNNLRTATKERYQTEQAYKNAQANLAKLKKQKKNTQQARRDVNAAKQNLNAANAKVNANTVVAANFKRKLDDSIKVIEDYNKITGALTQQQINNLKNYKNLNTASAGYTNTVLTLGKTTQYVNVGLGHVANTLANRAKTIDQAFETFGDGLKKAAWQLVTKAPVVAYGDLMSQLKNNVSNSDYLGNWRKGVSETERSNIIGNNRIGLRALGGGDEQKGFSNTTAIQQTAHQYGVTGADAIRLGLQFQQGLMQSGYRGTSNDTAQQMQIMHNFAAQIGVTDEALQDYTHSLIETGQMAALNAKYADKNDTDRRNAVNAEIVARAKLNTQLGLSLENQKAINQEMLNRRYGGIAATVMAGVQASLAQNEYNKNNPNDQITGDRAQRAREYFQTRNYNDSWTTEQRQQAFTDAQKLRASPKADLDASAGKGVGALLNAQARNAVFSATGYDIAGEGIEAQRNLAQGQAVAGTPVVSSGDYASLNKNILDTTNNAFIPFNKAVIDATESLKGLAQNPAGAAGGSALGAVGNFAGSLAGAYLGNKGGKGLISGGGKILGKIASLGAKFGGKSAIKSGAKVVGKGVLKKIPLVSILAGLGFGGYRALHGDWQGAGEEVASGAAGTIPGIGTAASVGIDAHLAYRDAMRDQQAAMDQAHLAKLSSADIGSMFEQSLQPNSVQPNNISAIVRPDEDGNGNNIKDKADATAENLDKLVKINQEQLDLAKKSDERDQRKETKAGSTLQYYNDHIKAARAGIGAKV